MTICVKLQRDLDFKPVVLWQREKWWVNKSTGGFFCIFKNSDSTWSHVWNVHRRLGTQREAIQEYLQIEHVTHVASQAEYRKLRSKVQQYVLEIIPPRRRLSPVPVAARKKCRRSPRGGTL